MRLLQPRWQATEFLDADDIPYDPEAVPHAPRRRPRRRRGPSGAELVGQVARAVVVTYVAWVVCWAVLKTGVPAPHALAWFEAILRHLPAPPPF